MILSRGLKFRNALKVQLYAALSWIFAFWIVFYILLFTMWSHMSRNIWVQPSVIQMLCDLWDALKWYVTCRTLCTFFQLQPKQLEPKAYRNRDKILAHKNSSRVESKRRFVKLSPHSVNFSDLFLRSFFLLEQCSQAAKMYLFGANVFPTLNS